MMLLLAFLVVLPQAANNEKPQAILDRAIAAMGGEEKVRKLGSCLYLSEAILYANGQPQPTMKMRRLVRLPDSVRLEIETPGKEKSQVTVYTLHNQKGWMHQEGQYSDMNDRLTQALRDDLHCLKVQYLLEAKDPRYSLQLLPRKRVEGVAAVGMNVRGEGVPDMNLYFDSATGLLLKSEMRVRDSVLGHMIYQEIFLQDYQPLAGIPYPTRIIIYQNYSKYMEMTVKELRPQATIRDNEFIRPGGS